MEGLSDRLLLLLDQEVVEEKGIVDSWLLLGSHFGRAESVLTLITIRLLHVLFKESTRLR